MTNTIYLESLGLHGMGPNKEDTPHAIFDKCNYKLIVSKHRTIFG